MVIRQPVNGAIFQTYDEVAPRRKMSRGMSIAIGASVVAHVAVGIYLYNANFNTPVPQQAAEKDPPMVWYTPDHPKPPPPQQQPQQQQSRIHDPVQTPQLTTTEPLPLTPDPVVKTAPADPGPTIGGAPTIPTPPPEAKKVIRPSWLARPDAEAMARYYPDRAIRMGVTGSATINCTVAANGAINSCDVVSETPANYGFGDAAKKLARFFKMRPQMEDGQPVAGGTIQIPIQFRLSDGG